MSKKPKTEGLATQAEAGTEAQPAVDQGTDATGVNYATGDNPATSATGANGPATGSEGTDPKIDLAQSRADEARAIFVCDESHRLASCFEAVGILEDDDLRVVGPVSEKHPAAIIADFVRAHPTAPGEAAAMQVHLVRKEPLRYGCSDPARRNLALGLYKIAVEGLAAIKAEETRAAEARRQAEVWEANATKPVAEESRGVGAEVQHDFAPSSLSKSLPA